MGADEEVFEMNNGCICCTVRGDLIRIVEGLMKRRGKFDAIIVETEPDGATTAIEVGPSTSTAVAAPGTDVSSEVAALRAAVEALTARLESTKAG